METQQMMELLLARMNTIIKEHMQEMMARMETNQAKLMAEREADRKKGKADFEKMMAERKAIHEKREAERKVGREVATRLAAIHKTDAIQMRVKPKMKTN
jgi:hypothetical protein